MIKDFAKDRIAVVYAQGDVVMGDEGEGSVSADTNFKSVKTGPHRFFC